VTNKERSFSLTFFLFGEDFGFGDFIFGGEFLALGLFLSFALALLQTEPSSARLNN